MFGALLEKARTLSNLALRQHLSREERRDILIRLKPVEKLTRQLLIAEAATYLLVKLSEDLGYDLEAAE